MRRFLRPTLYVALGLTTTKVAYDIYSFRHPLDQHSFDPSKKTLVVLGSGWGATSFIKDLDTMNTNLIVISPRNYFLFTPLLPSTSVGTVELRSIMQPMRYITRHMSREAQFIEGECIDIQPDVKTIKVKDSVNPEMEHTVKYDQLVIACGAENATFGIPGVKEYACFLKEAW
jgi:NADH:ubiquinone reductase (non-electrogenic)